jgi:hypothetical protein
MPTIIPFVPSVGLQAFSTVIGTTQYQIQASWSVRESCWYFDLAEYDGTKIVTNQKIVLGTYLARWCKHPLFVGGAFLARCNVLPHRDPMLDDLGDVTQVYYYTRAEMVAQILSAMSPAP